MERGTIRSVGNTGGLIADIQGQPISFNSSAFVGKSRSDLKPGDAVWFERIGTGISAKAINVRKG